MSEKIWHIRWNDHESLVRARSNTEARQQAQLLYGRDALSWRMCLVRIADDLTLIRLIRAGAPVLQFTLPIKRTAIRAAERSAYRNRVHKL